MSLNRAVSSANANNQKDSKADTKATLPKNMLLIEAIKEMGIAPKDKKIVEDKLNAVYKNYRHVDEHAKDEKEDKYPLDYAIEYANPFAVEWLINKFGRFKKGNKINRKIAVIDKDIDYIYPTTTSPWTPFLRSISFSDSIDDKSSIDKKHEIEFRKRIIHILVKNGANLWDKFFYKNEIENKEIPKSPLHEAINKNNRTLLEIFFNQWQHASDEQKNTFITNNYRWNRGNFHSVNLIKHAVETQSHQVDYLLQRLSEITTLWQWDDECYDHKLGQYYSFQLTVFDFLIKQNNLALIETLMKHGFPKENKGISLISKIFISKINSLKNKDDQKEIIQKMNEAKEIINLLIKNCRLSITSNDLCIASRDNGLDAVKVLVEDYKVPVDISHLKNAISSPDSFIYLIKKFEERELKIQFRFSIIEFSGFYRNYKVQKELLLYGYPIEEAKEQEKKQQEYYNRSSQQNGHFQIDYYISTIESILALNEVNAAFYLSNKLNAEDIQDLKKYFQKRGNEKSNKFLNELLMKISSKDQKHDMPPATNPDSKLVESIKTLAPMNMPAPGPLPSAPAVDGLFEKSSNEEGKATPSSAPISIIAPGGPQDVVIGAPSAPSASVASINPMVDEKVKAVVTPSTQPNEQPPLYDDQLEGHQASAISISSNEQDQKTALSSSPVPDSKDAKEKSGIIITPKIDAKKESPASSGIGSLSLFAPTTPQSSMSICSSASTEGSTQLSLQSSIKQVEDILTLMKIAERNPRLSSELTAIAGRELVAIGLSVSTATRQPLPTLLACATDQSRNVL